MPEVEINIEDSPLCRYLRWRDHNPEPPVEVIPTVYGTPPKKPDHFPVVVKWRGFLMPDHQPCAAWPPVYKPYYGGESGISKWAVKGTSIWIETTIESEEMFHKFVFSNWGLKPSGESKVTDRKDGNGLYQVIDQSNL